MRDVTLRAAGIAALCCLGLVVGHYAIWSAKDPAFGAVGPNPVIAAAVMVGGSGILFVQAWRRRRPESQLDTVAPERGLAAWTIAIWLVLEACLLALVTLGFALNVHVAAAMVAVVVLSGPLALPAFMPRPALGSHPWSKDLEEAVEQAQVLRAAAPPTPPAARPGFLREVTNPGVSFRDVVGLQDAKRDVAEAFQLIQDPSLARRHGIEPVRGVLLHGPPGTGKTFFARAAAGQFAKRFLEVRASDLVSQYVGETEKNIAAAFAYARTVAPCILFFDEVDGLARNRAHARNDWEVSRVNALLTEMDGISKDDRAPIVIAATNRPDDLDPAVLRPGRFDRMVHVGLPNAADRAAMLRAMLQGSHLAPGADGPWLVEATAGMSPAELKALVQEVRRRIFREGAATPRPIAAADFQAALAQGVARGRRLAIQ